VKSRWPIVVIALLAAAAFAISVWAGRWWSIGDVEIGPFGSKQCFGGDCRPTSLTWVGGSERWMRMGMATWAGGLISMLVLLITAAGVAAKRVPRLAARTALVAIGTTTITGVLFVMQYPGVDGATVDRGLWLWLAAIILGSIAAVGVVRARIPAAVD
jgi:hypothetical protein